ncbi:Ulp1 family isopeptidase [Bradyrhizobium sp. UFLA05-109]
MDLPSQLSDPAVGIQATVPAEDFPHAEDFTHIVGSGWEHGCQSAPDTLIGSLPATPLESRPHFYIHGRPYTTKFGQGAKEATLNNPRGLSVTLIPGRGLEPHETVGARIEGFPKHVGETSSSTRAGVKRSRTSEAEELLGGFRAWAVENNFADRTARQFMLNLRRFNGFLQSRGLALDDLLDDQNQLAERAAEYEQGPHKRVERALTALQDFRAGNVGGPLRGPRSRYEYPEDAALLIRFAAATGGLGVPKQTIVNTGSRLRAFAKWLKANDKPSMASRFLTNLIADDVLEYRRQGGDPDDLLDVALSHLRRFGPGEQKFVRGAGPRVMGRRTLAPYPDDARIIDAVANQRLRNLGPGAARNTQHARASNQRTFSDWLQKEDRGSIVSRLNGSEQQEEALQKDYGDFRRDTGYTAGVPFGPLRQYLQLVKANAALEVGPPEHAQEAEPAKREGFDLSEWPPPAAAPSPSVGARPSHIHGDLSSRLDLASTPHALRHDPPSAPVRDVPPPSDFIHHSGVGQTDGQASGSERPLALAETEWLGDEHIAADYALLEQELQGDNRDLAVRTRFVRPAQAHLLRSIENQSVLLESFHAIVNDQDGNDTANFLFVPVNNAAPGGGGTHWSLLLVDRRERARPVAYHYDSRGTTNSAVAAELAARLGAHLAPARMAQQQNGYDCGVFLVDGTRALVGRLAQGERPQHEPLHLDSLIADRQVLQNRLSGRPGWG